MRKIGVFVWLISVGCLALTNDLFSQQGRLIFDRYVEHDNDVDLGYAEASVVLPLLRPSQETPNNRHPESYQYLTSNNLWTCLQPTNATRPGSTSEIYPNGDQLAQTLDWMASSTSENFNLDLVLAVVETGSPVDDIPIINDIIELVHDYPFPGISSAKVGAYNYYPGPYDISYNRPSRANRQEVSNYYLNVDTGLEIANPACYPYMTYRFHHSPPSSDSNTWPVGERSPTNRSALFWAPIQRLTYAKQHLPTGHLLVPYVSGVVVHNNYPTPVPTLSDLTSMMKHFRLRGADGYNKRPTIQNAIYPAGDFWPNHETWIKTKSQQEISNYYANAWLSLDEYFGAEPSTAIHSLPDLDDIFSEKKSGAIYSGIRHVNDVMVLISNLGLTNYQFTYDERFNLNIGYIDPISIPTPGPDNGLNDPPGAELLSSEQHQTHRFKILNLINNGDFEQGSSGWYINVGHSSPGNPGPSAEIVNGRSGNGLKLLKVYSALSNSSITEADLEPGAGMKVQITAKVENPDPSEVAKLDCAFYYTKVNGDRATINVVWGAGSTNDQSVTHTNFVGYSGRFSVPYDAKPGTTLRPILYDRANTQSIVLDDIIVKFDDRENLILNGDFDNSDSKNPNQSHGWYFPTSNTTLLADPEITGNQIVKLGSGNSMYANSFNEFLVNDPTQPLELSFKAKGDGLLQIVARQIDVNGDQLSVIRIPEAGYLVYSQQMEKFSKPFPPLNPLTARLELIVRNMNNANLYIDDIAVKEVIELP